jgi:hypothetical protein
VNDWRQGFVHTTLFVCGDCKGSGCRKCSQTGMLACNGKVEKDVMNGLAYCHACDCYVPTGEVA